MTAFVLRRLALAIPTIAIIVSLSFLLMRFAPGGPFDAEADLSPEALANLRAAYDLDKPLVEQFFGYWAGLFRGDLGPSISYPGSRVVDLIARGLPVTVTIGVTALAIATVVGALAGIAAALRQNSALDYAVMTLAMTGIAVPNFVIAPFLTLVFGLWLKLLPIAGLGAGWKSYVLPILVVALPQIAAIARLTRGAMLEVLRSDYVRTARAKGLKEGEVVLRHAMKSAAIPVVSFLGPALAGVMTGSVIVEQIFGLPGVGRYFVGGAINRDYPLVLGTVILFAVSIIVVNLLVDLLYGWLDPKTRVNA
jgi:oligopeptide transport system permease protein